MRVFAPPLLLLHAPDAVARALGTRALLRHTRCVRKSELAPAPQAPESGFLCHCVSVAQALAGAGPAVARKDRASPDEGQAPPLHKGPAYGAIRNPQSEIAFPTFLASPASLTSCILIRKIMMLPLSPLNQPTEWGRNGFDGAHET